MRLPLALLIFGLLASAPLSAASVYRYVDKDGTVHYTDQPPDKTSKPVVLPPIQVISPSDPIAPPAASRGAREEAVGADMGVRIVSPTPEETFRGDDRRLPVSVGLNQKLPEGYGLLYLLDGRPQNLKATRETGYVMQGVERGEHLIAVAVVNAAGREVARSAPVIVHMKPPTVQLSR